MGYLTTALMLFFGVSLAFTIGLYGIPEFVEVVEIGNQYQANLTDETPSNQFYNDIIAEWLIPTLIGAAAVLIALTAGQAMEIVIAAGAVGFFANKLLLPISMIYMAGLPEPLPFIIIGFMNLLLLVAIFGFIRGVEP